MSKHPKPTSPAAADSTSTSVRLDVWLWAARFLKTRSLAKTSIEAGRVRSAGQVVNKPSRAVHIGDMLSLPAGHDRIEIEVLGLSTQRGPAPIARTLYRETTASAAARAAAAEARKAAPSFTPPPGRPDKQARRRLIGFLEQIEDPHE